MHKKQTENTNDVKAQSWKWIYLNPKNHPETLYSIVHNGGLYSRSLSGTKDPWLVKKVYDPNDDGSFTVREEFTKGSEVIKRYTKKHSKDTESKYLTRPKNRYIDLQSSQNNVYSQSQSGMIHVDTETVDLVQSIFAKITQNKKIRVVPDKLLIFKPGDYCNDMFTPEFAPGTNMHIGTVFLTSQGTLKSVILDGCQSEEPEGNMLIMFSGVRHRVDYVNEYCEIITFNVYSL